jgi:hypothetical protein
VNTLVYRHHRLARDAESPDLESFPFAISVSMISMAGVCLIGCGIIGTSGWLTAVGFLISLAGCAFYGWSLYDE